MWQVTGCQHSLIQPPHDDYAPPTIPALSLKGFSRWESLEILLGPEEHVPFIQYAVKNWNLKHPVTGEAFPADLPSNVFPAQIDAEVDKWHKSCAAALWHEATTERRAAERERERASSPEKTEPKFAYAHVKPHVKPTFYTTPPQTAHARPEQMRRPFSYVQVPRPGAHPRQQPPQSRSPERPREGPADAHDRARRRSFSDIPSPTAHEDPHHSSSYNSSSYADPKLRRPTQQRRHSQPRHQSSESSSDEPVEIPKTRHRQQQSPPTPPYSRRNANSSSQQPAGGRSQRSEVRDSELKRHGGNSPRGSIRDRVSEKVSSLFPGSRPNDRPHDGSRHSSYNTNNNINSSPRPARRNIQQQQQRPPASRAARVESDIDSLDTSDPESSEGEAPKRRPIRSREGERDRYRERGRPFILDRELDDDMESAAARRTRQHLRRPDTFRRTSSHADADRRVPNWDSRDKDRERDRLRDERKRYERRSPDRDRDRESPNAGSGVSSRRYAEPAYA